MTKLAQKFKDEYFKKLEDRYYMSPGDYGRDNKIFKDLCRDFSEEELCQMIEVYFTIPSQRYSVPFFKMAINEIRQVMKKEQKKAMPIMANPESWRYEDS